MASFVSEGIVQFSFKSLHAGYFFSFVAVCRFLFKSNMFKMLLQKHCQRGKRFDSSLVIDVLSVLI